MAMSLEEYIRTLLDVSEVDLQMEIEPAFRFELPLPNEEADGNA